MVDQHGVLGIALTVVAVVQGEGDRVARIGCGGLGGFLDHQLGRLTHVGHNLCRLLRGLIGIHEGLVGQRVAHLCVGRIHVEGNRIALARVQVGQLPCERCSPITGRRWTGVGRIERRVTWQAVSHRNARERHLAGIGIGQLVTEYFTGHDLCLIGRPFFGQFHRGFCGVVRDLCGFQRIAVARNAGVGQLCSQRKILRHSRAHVVLPLT